MILKLTSSWESQSSTTFYHNNFIIHNILIIFIFQNLLYNIGLWLLSSSLHSYILTFQSNWYIWLLLQFLSSYISLHRAFITLVVWLGPVNNLFKNKDGVPRMNIIILMILVIRYICSNCAKIDEPLTLNLSKVVKLPSCLSRRLVLLYLLLLWLPLLEFILC